MQNLIDFFTDEQEKVNFIAICNDNALYQTWREKNPNILDILLSFPSIKVRFVKYTAEVFKQVTRLALKYVIYCHCLLE